MRKLGYINSPQTELANQHFGAGTSAAVRVLQEQVERLESKGIVDQRTTHGINAQLDALRRGGDEKPVEGTFVIRCIVQIAGGKSFTADLVHAYDIDMRSEEPLGEAPLGERDAYEIRSKREQIPPPKDSNTKSCVSVDETLIKLSSSGAVDDR